MNKNNAEKKNKSRLGKGRYGSELHLLRYLGRHRNRLDERILAVVGAGTRIDWLDFPFAPDNSGSDAEWKGIDFIEDRKVRRAWTEFWPQGGGVQNWDAVGCLDCTGSREWLLVEAKAHVGEIVSRCLAKDKVSREQIANALETTKRTLSVPPDRDWLNGYYQFCNRLAVLYFLHQQDVKAHLLFFYFVGDKRDNCVICPDTEAGWHETLKAQDEHVGLPKNHLLSARIHKLFLPVGESCQ